MLNRHVNALRDPLIDERRQEVVQQMIELSTAPKALHNESRFVLADDFFHVSTPNFRAQAHQKCASCLPTVHIDREILRLIHHLQMACHGRD